MRGLRAKVEKYKNANKQLQRQIDTAVGMVKKHEQTHTFAIEKTRVVAEKEQKKLGEKIAQLERQLIRQEKQQEVVDALRKMIASLNKRLEEAPTYEQIATYEQTIKTLSMEVKDKDAELALARKYHTPTMQHYTLLQMRVSELEVRNGEREAQLQKVISQQKRTMDMKEEEINNRWRVLFLEKAQRASQLQEQVEELTSIFKILRGSGVVLPASLLNAMTTAM
eukprot:m.62810 g.62810  ORF g.62810 m.62810 type:complete len:224 (+) comp8042_c2_seq1:577-1248(+)